LLSEKYPIDPIIIIPNIKRTIHDLIFSGEYIMIINKSKLTNKIR